MYMNLIWINSAPVIQINVTALSVYMVFDSISSNKNRQVPKSKLDNGKREVRDHECKQTLLEVFKLGDNWE